MTLILSGTSGLSDVDGSAATPAIRGTDANTGIFFPAADTIAFSEGGAEIARFDSSGNLGIGTSSPSTKLHLYGATDQRIRFENTGWTKAYQIGNDQNALSFYDVTAAAERMRITSDGLLQFDSGYGSVATAYGCRAWVNFNGTGTVAIRGSGNVSSITDNGAGLYTVNFTTAMPDANYSTVITNVGFSATSTQRNSTIAGVFNSAPTTYTTSAVRVATGNPASASLEDNVVMCVSIFR